MTPPAFARGVLQHAGGYIPPPGEKPLLLLLPQEAVTLSAHAILRAWETDPQTRDCLQTVFVFGCLDPDFVAGFQRHLGRGSEIFFVPINAPIIPARLPL